MEQEQRWHGYMCVCVFGREGWWCREGDLWPRGVCMHGCVGRVCGHRGDLRDSQPVQLSWTGDTTQPIHGACVPSGGKKQREREADIFFFFLCRKTPELSKWVSMCASVPDDKMLKYGAYWTKLRVQNQSWESDGWGCSSEAIAMTTGVNKHYPRQRLITALSMWGKQGEKTFTQRTTERQRHYKQEQKWPQPSENIVAGKVKWCWTAVVGAQREGEGPAVFLRRQRSVEPNLHSHILPRLIHEQD